MRAAAVDIGTNTVLLSIAERRDGRLVPLAEEATITRLGAGVDRTRALDAQACARTLACLERYARVVASHAVDRLDAVGTSALRDAEGREAFLDAAERILGTRPRVIAGEEEARLTFAGATSGLDLEGDVIVFDIGGGSTEIVQGRVEARDVASWVSLDIGSVRLFERHVRHDPPSREELDEVEASVARALAPLTAGAHRALVGVAGTVTTLAAVAGGTAHEPGALHGGRLSAGEVARVGERLARMPLGERVGLAGLDPGRADVIVVGALLLRAILSWAGDDELVISDRGVRWGLLEQLLIGA